MTAATTAPIAPVRQHVPDRLTVELPADPHLRRAIERAAAQDAAERAAIARARHLTIEGAR